MKTVKYKVTSMMGLFDIGDIIESIVLLEDDDSSVALLYHPRSKSSGDCASIEFAKRRRSDGFYVTAAAPASFINIDSTDEIKKFQAALNEVSYADVVLDENNKISHLGWLTS